MKLLLLLFASILSAADLTTWDSGAVVTAVLTWNTGTLGGSGNVLTWNGAALPSGGPTTPIMISGSNACYGSTNGTTSAPLTYGSSANFVAVGVSWYDPGPDPTVTVSIGGGPDRTLTGLTAATVTGTHQVRIFYLTPVDSGTTYTATVTGTGSYAGFCTRAYGGMASTSVFQTGTDAGAQCLGSPCDTSEDGSPIGSTLVLSAFGIWADNAPMTVGAPFTNLDQIAAGTGINIGVAFADLYQASGSATHATWSTTTLAAYSPMVIAAFKGQ